MKTRPKTISLSDLIRQMSPEEQQRVWEHYQYYSLLFKFREAREQKGWSQEELAKKAKINRSTLSKIESGIQNATLDTLMKLAKALGLELELRLG